MLDNFIYGTTDYLAPELIESNQNALFESDMWSLGVTIYLLIFGQFPFKGADD